MSASSSGHTEQQLAELLADFVMHSEDGYAVIDAADKMLVCNSAFADIFARQADDIVGQTFEQLARYAYAHRQGIKIDSDDIEYWLTEVALRRRQRSYRVFEVDLIDGRWFLFSEQVLPDGRMLLQTKQITRQKLLEQSLQDDMRSLRQLALTDELTQIANRRCFVESVQTELSRCRRQHCQVAMMLIDLDYFKTVNDTYGHQAGDLVLKQTAALIKKTLREYDTFGRIGGEEFAIFLAETDEPTAIMVAERVLQQVAAHQIGYQTTVIQVTVSIGLACKMTLASFETLYNEADLALYQAKHQGRNQVVLAHNPLQVPS